MNHHELERISSFQPMRHSVQEVGNTEDLALSPGEGKALVRMCETLTLPDARRFSSSEPEALLLLLGADKLASTLRVAGF